jgi:hypothetical protein
MLPTVPDPFRSPAGLRLAATSPARAAPSSATWAPRHFLSRFDYDGKDTEIAGQSDPLIVQRGIDAVGD